MKNNTETRLGSKQWIDQMDIDSSITLMLNNQKEAFHAVKKSLPNIKNAIEKICQRLSKSRNGRIVYVGAGTSARIGVQDGAELLPTFEWPRDRVEFVIAGGKDSLIQSKENAEDSHEDVLNQFSQININKNDCLLSISASGETLFTCSAIVEAKKKGCLTIGIGNNANSTILKNSDCPILLKTGSEVVAGSTRLKAGTAQKICLNIISTQVMTNLGNVKNGMMVNMKPRNKKLRQRKKNICKILKNDQKSLND